MPLRPALVPRRRDQPCGKAAELDVGAILVPLALDGSFRCACDA